MDNPFVPRFGRGRDPHPRQVAFEYGSVDHVLEGFGLRSCRPGLVRRFEEKWGRSWLTFEVFSEAFPTFPILLEAHSFYGMARAARPAALFRSFGETFFLRRYLEVHERGRGETGGRPIGMVFPFDGYRGGMLMHDGQRAAGDTLLVHHLAGGGPPHRVTVEPFVSYVRWLARGGWTPATPAPVGTPGETPKVRRRRTVVRPWMTRALGCGPDKDVLAFLWTVLHTRSGPRLEFLRREGAERHVVIDHAGLARETGLSPEQVKRGLAGLRGRGLIATHQRQYRGHVTGHILVVDAAIRDLARR